MDREEAWREAKAAQAQPAPPRVRREENLLKRYQSGEFEQVWQDIRSHERIDGGFRDEVTEVAEAAMRRVARNVDLIADRLPAVGWQALSAEYHDLCTLAKASDLAVLVRIEEISGCRSSTTVPGVPLGRLSRRDRHAGRRDVQDFVARFGKGLLLF